MPTMMPASVVLTQNGRWLNLVAVVCSVAMKPLDVMPIMSPQDEYDAQLGQAVQHHGWGQDDGFGTKEKYGDGVGTDSSQDDGREAGKGIVQHDDFQGKNNPCQRCVEGCGNGRCRSASNKCSDNVIR